MEMIRGCQRCACSKAASRLAPAARATIWKRSGKDSATLRVLRPIDPVDPRMAMCFIIERSEVESYFTRFLNRWGCGMECLLHHAPSHVKPEHWSGEEQGIDSVKHASVAGENCAGILDAGAALDQRLHQIAKLRGDIQGDGEQKDWPHFGLLQSEETISALDQPDTKQK